MRTIVTEEEFKELFPNEPLSDKGMRFIALDTHPDGLRRKGDGLKRFGFFYNYDSVPHDKPVSSIMNMIFDEPAERSILQNRKADVEVIEFFMKAASNNTFSESFKAFAKPTMEEDDPVPFKIRLGTNLHRDPWKELERDLTLAAVNFWERAKETLYTHPISDSFTRTRCDHLMDILPYIACLGKDKSPVSTDQIKTLAPEELPLIIKDLRTDPYRSAIAYYLKTVALTGKTLEESGLGLDELIALKKSITPHTPRKTRRFILPENNALQ
ncbi:MAG: hypothetical protein FWF24_06500 [Alphaproteobacteria bacterium]|nr:hypothetical protein [Alphaproteobacteria bacterium]